MNVYRYSECGLDHVVIEGLTMIVDDDDETAVTIPNMNGLHRAIALGIVRKRTGMTGRELRFLRTEMGMTQAELAAIVHREPLAISRWERGEIDIDNNAEVLIRMCATEGLELEKNATIQEMAGWCVASAENEPLVIDGSDPSNYKLKDAA
jgi:transcriptional regulator with XRE-family HTH domain